LIGSWHRVRQLIVAVVAATAAACTAIVAIASWPIQVPSFEAVRADYVPSDAWLLDRHGVVLDSKRIRFDIRRLEWTPLSQVSPALVTAIVNGEDRDFWGHSGIEWRSVLGAVRDQLWRHQRRGASTITMQLASLLQHRHSKRGFDAWLGKIEQVREARALEQRWSKTQILEAYLNLLDYQGDLQGIAAATAQLAGKSPSGLSIPESLLLAALLPQPGASAERIVARACARAPSTGPAVDCDILRATADSLLVPRATVISDRLAPQLAERLLKTPGERLRTTIDAHTQRLTRDILAAHLGVLVERNVRDGAALVVDNATGEVIAYVGSAGPQSRAPAVDGVQAARQAGSTLKPFLYEMALERRYLTAASLLADSPLSLDTASGVYIPQDYDHEFKGLVSVRTALAGSLNVPAVRTLVLVGLDAFRDRLHDLGYSDIKQDGQYYGYSLALGSAEVTLWQQAQAYRSLARGGQWSPLTLDPSGGLADSKSLLPADASFIISDILGDPAARAVTFGLDSRLNMPFWTAVKTGTSEDMRDNWCTGFSSRFTVAVWVGNFEGDSMHDVSGVTGAAPIWHDLMAALHPGLESKEPDPPSGVTPFFTHFSPSAEPSRREWYLRGAEMSNRAVAAVPERVRPSIESPANGMVIAIDPDIPADHQRVLISARGAEGTMRLKLNDLLLGSAVMKRLWDPRPGAYYLTLEDSTGRQIDRIFFTVRGAPL
jgi:penicillin-binding protein 1C